MTISQDLLKRVILDQHADQYWPPLYFKRTAEAKLDYLSQNQEIIVLTGVRRCGKSILLEHVRRTYKTGNEESTEIIDSKYTVFVLPIWKWLRS